ncbi:unnamed protein product [Closterium sp. NIES-54]
MVQQVLQRFDFTYSSPQATPLSTRHSLSALPSDESVEPSGLYPELVGCLMYLMTCTQPDLAYPLSILARYVAPSRHRPEHMAAAERVLRYLCSTSGMGLVLGGRSPVVLTGHADASGCEAEIYAGAMAAQELRWLTYLLTDLAEPPRSPPVLYVDNKAMLALCREHRLEHRTKHIALRYFLAREMQQCGQLRLAYVASQANTADIFTKALQPCDHQRFCTMLESEGSGGAAVRGAGSGGAGSWGAVTGGADSGVTGAGDAAGAGGAGGASGAAGAGGTGAAGAGGAGATVFLPAAAVSPPQLLPGSSLPTPAPHTEVSESLTERCEPETRASTPVRARRIARPRPPAVPSTHGMALRPSFFPQRLVLPEPPASSLPHVTDPECDLARAASPTVTRLLATVITDLTLTQHDYELHSLDFSTAFLQGNLHEEIWLRRPPGFTGSFPAVKAELQERHTCTDLGELRSYLGLEITRDRERRTITLTQSHMVHQVLQRFGFQFSSPQPTPLSTNHSLSAPPSDESVEPSAREPHCPALQPSVLRPAALPSASRPTAPRVVPCCSPRAALCCSARHALLQPARRALQPCTVRVLLPCPPCALPCSPRRALPCPAAPPNLAKPRRPARPALPNPSRAALPRSPAPPSRPAATTAAAAAAAARDNAATGNAAGAGGAGGATGSAGGAAGAGGAGPTTDRHCLSWHYHGSCSGAHCLSQTTPPLGSFASGFFSEPRCVTGSVEAAALGAGESAAALGASESAAAPDASESAATLGTRASPAAGPSSAEALNTFTLDSDASCCFFRDCTSLTPLAALVPVSLADPTGGRVVARASTILPWETDQELYFLLVVDDYTRYTTVFPLRRKAGVSDVLIPWIRATHRQLCERFSRDFPVLHEGIHQTFTLPASLQQNGIAEHRIGLIMELNLWPRVSVPETSPTLRWTGKVGGYTRTCPTRSPSRLSSWFQSPPGRSPPPQGPAPSGVSEVDPTPLVEPLEISSESSGPAEGGDLADDDTAATRRSPRLENPPGFPPRLSSPPPQPAAVDSGAETNGVEPRGAETEGAGSGGAATGGADSGGTAGAGGTRGTVGGAGGATSARGTGAGGNGAAGAGGVVRAGGATGAASSGGAGGTAGAGARGTGGAVAAGPGGARIRGLGAARAGGAAGAGGAGGATGAAGTGGAGGTAGSGGAGAGGTGGTGAAGAAGPRGARTRGAGAAGAGGTAGAGGDGAGGTRGAGGTTSAGVGGTGGTRAAGAASPGGARTRGAGAAGAGGTAGAGGAGAGGTGCTGGAGAAGPRGARTRGAGVAGAGGAAVAGGAGGATGAAGIGGAGGTAGAGGAGAAGSAPCRQFFYPQPQSSLPPPDLVLRQVLSLLSSIGLTPPLFFSPTDQSQPQLLRGSSLPAPAPHTKETKPLTRASTHVRARRVACPRPHAVPGTHGMALLSECICCLACSGVLCSEHNPI